MFEKQWYLFLSVENGQFVITMSILWRFSRFTQTKKWNLTRTWNWGGEKIKSDDEWKFRLIKSYSRNSMGQNANKTDLFSVRPSWWRFSQCSSRQNILLLTRLCWRNLMRRNTEKKNTQMQCNSITLHSFKMRKINYNEKMK